MYSERGDDSSLISTVIVDTPRHFYEIIIGESAEQEWSYRSSASTGWLSVELSTITFASSRTYRWLIRCLYIVVRPWCAFSVLAKNILRRLIINASKQLTNQRAVAWYTSEHDKSRQLQAVSNKLTHILCLLRSCAHILEYDNVASICVITRHNVTPRFRYLFDRCQPMDQAHTCRRLKFN